MDMGYNHDTPDRSGDTIFAELTGLLPTNLSVADDPALGVVVISVEDWPLQALLAPKAARALARKLNGAALRLEHAE